MKKPNFDIRSCPLPEVQALCARFHGYGSASKFTTYNFGVYEEGRIVAVYSWQPPPVGAAKAICPEAPAGVLALSRMVAVPKDERKLKHVSRPLRHQMLRLIDRTRWPVLVTYHDESQGHTGHVYKCSGWQETAVKKQPIWVDQKGRRRSRLSNEKDSLLHGGYALLHRWEHWVCDRGDALKWMTLHGWERVPSGRVWRSGNPAYTFVRKLQ